MIKCFTNDLEVYGDYVKVEEEAVLFLFLTGNFAIINLQHWNCSLLEGCR